MNKKNRLCVDRCILVLNNNPMYIDFWNYSSKFWKTKYGIIPTLFFYGDQVPKELSKEFGEIYQLPFIKEATVNPNRDWVCTWGLFYGASQFPEDICMLCGLDQLPLSDKFFKDIEQYDFDKDYVIGIGDAYTRGSHYDWYPSSHHVAKGKIYKKALKLNESWREQVLKVFDKRGDYGEMYGGSDFWGLEELHSTYLLKQYKYSIVHNGFFDGGLNENRFDTRGDSSITNINVSKLKSGGYSEVCLPRPMGNKTKDFVDFLYDNSPSYVKKEEPYYCHETSIIDSGAEVGDGTSIWHFSHICAGAKIGKNCSIGQNVFIAPNVTIGDNVKIQNGVSVYTGVEVEDYVFLGPHCVFTNDLYPRSYGDWSITPTKIRKGASIGANATILCGVELGEFSMVACGSVVTKNVEEKTLVIGNPARFKKKLKDPPKI